MILVTSPDVPGRKIDRVLGLVRGNTIRGRHVGHDVQALFRNMAGGEIKEYTKMMAEAREQSIDRMVDEARALGADAVVALRFQTCEIMKGAAEMLCYGTAVTFCSDE
jgi:uncharacterized protein YbjQ (UPF0145 family)